MPVLTRGDLTRAGAGARGVVVVAFCAAWCDVCREFRAAYEGLDAAVPGATWVWLDIEDDADLCGDVDVENFPTIAVLRGAGVLHFGTTLPSGPGVARLVEAVARSAPLREPPAAVAELAARILAGGGPRPG